MKFPPYWTRTESIHKLLYELDVLKTAYALHPIASQTAKEIQRQSLLKSSLYSARIEGNPLTFAQISQSGVDDPQERHTKEVANIYQALEYIQQKKDNTIDTKMLRALHEIILDGLSADAGHIRTEESAIYNQAGVAVYLPPAPQRIHDLLEEWYAYILSSADPCPIKAGVAHIWFEKIHPFLDGNGRVGRVITHGILMKESYDFGGVIPLEEYLDTHRDLYYQALSRDHADVTPFVLFFLEAVVSQGRTAMITAKDPPSVPYPTLLPRRRELVALVTEHTLVSFDFLSRRFIKIPKRTLHHDISQLTKDGYLQKVGSTRGALYTVGEKIRK